MSKYLYENEIIGYPTYPETYTFGIQIGDTFPQIPFNTGQITEVIPEYDAELKKVQSFQEMVRIGYIASVGDGPNPGLPKLQPPEIIKAEFFITDDGATLRTDFKPVGQAVSYHSETEWNSATDQPIVFKVKSIADPNKNQDSDFIEKQFTEVPEPQKLPDPVIESFTLEN